MTQGQPKEHVRVTTQAIVTSCPVHIRRPDTSRLCRLCLTAIDVNRMNPGWASAGYNPVPTWDGPEAFELVSR